MSKSFQAFPVLFVLTLVFWLSDGALARDMEVEIKLAGSSRVDVSGVFGPESARRNPQHFTLLDEYAGVSGLSRRFDDFKFFARDGATIRHKMYSASELVAERPIDRFSYSVDLTPMNDLAVLAHTSWVSEKSALLILDDILPQLSGKTALVRIIAPSGWKIDTLEKRISGDSFSVADVGAAVFFVGIGHRTTRSSRNDRLTVSLSGGWLFTDAEAVSMAESIYSAYERRFGKLQTGDRRILISRYPVTAPPGTWGAGTRGRNITIVASDMPFRSQSLQRLHEQLRHEIFHLWIPNGVDLSGNYDLFYEGFALYESLKVGVSLNRIRFDDYLDSLSRAINIDALESKRGSLVEASKNRWYGANTQLYARGMLVAFACDLALLARSGGKSSAAEVVREVFSRHRVGSALMDGNTAVLKILRGYPELVPLIDGTITGDRRIEWEPLLSTVGLELEVPDGTSRLRTVVKPSGRQRDLLDRLGYNSWRKLSGSKK
jgi:hypothetical protein